MKNNQRPDFDGLIQDIADYVRDYRIQDSLSLHNAYLNFCDTLACGLLALQESACLRRMGPVVPGAVMDNGARVPGTSLSLDPVQAAFNIGCMNRWLDFNDYWGAAEWNHPSDNIASLLAVADYLGRAGGQSISMEQLFVAIVKAIEIQGVMAIDNSFNRVGLDHVLLVKLASTAVSAGLLACDRNELMNAISMMWVDGQSLRAYRQSPNTGPRKSWAAGDAASRAVRLALMAKAGEPGCPSAITDPNWGFCARFFAGNALTVPQDFGEHIINHLSFKLPSPTEFHAQTALEAAIALHPVAKGRLDQIEKIVIRTQESAHRIINKQGPLYNPADRDHCIQYIVAVGLIKGSLDASDYEDEAAANPMIDQLRDCMRVEEDPSFTAAYQDPDRRAVSNAVQLFFSDGSCSEDCVVEYALGQPQRREQAVGALYHKLDQALSVHYDAEHAAFLQQMLHDPAQIGSMPVTDLMDLLCIKMAAKQPASVLS